MKLNNTATLILEDGNQFRGLSFGYNHSVAGEIVFNTAMTGYPESLTDPSYSGQIMLFTYPLIGNYGVPSRELISTGISKFLESEQIHPIAIVIGSYSDECSHWNAETTLSDWLNSEKIPGICQLDTRAITKILREKGTMKCKIIFDNEHDIEFYDSNMDNQVARVSCKEVIRYNANTGNKKIILVDCGVKHNIIRHLISQNFEIVRVPWDYDWTDMWYDGLFISNGPGNPDYCDITVQNIRKSFNVNKPICGVCMGNQLLAKAAGASTYKLKYGHRSHNQPVRLVGSNLCFVTSQNHGYAVDDTTLESDWESMFMNMNDNTNEGIKHKNKPFFAAQFHPEANGGPTDTEFVFDKFAIEVHR